MGATESKSTITNTVNQNIINNTDLQMIKENITKNNIEAITKSSASCSAQIQAQQLQEVTLGNVGGDLNFTGGAQDQTVILNLSCVQLSKVQNDMAQNIANAFGSQIETKFDTEAMAKLEANAKSDSTRGALAVGSSSSESNVNNTYNLNVKNNISQTMKDIIVNETNKTFNTEKMQKALSTINSKQEQIIKAGDVGKNANIEMGEQKQKVELFMKAVQEDETINSSIDKIANQLNSISSAGVTTKASGDIKATATSEATAKGVDSVIDSFFSGIANIFGQFKWIIIAAVIGIVLIGVVFFLTGGQETLQKGIETAGEKMGGGSRIGVNEINKNNINLVHAFKSLKMSELLI
jgi:hypothetical protein